MYRKLIKKRKAERNKKPETSKQMKARWKSEQEQQEYEKFHLSDKRPVIVYLLLVSPTNEPPYYKIGHTSTNPHNRFRNSEIPSYVVLAQKSFQNKEGKDIETMLHEVFKAKRYHPLSKFDGHTECFCLTEDDIRWLSTKVLK